MPPRFSLFDTAAGRCAIAWTDRGVVTVRLVADDPSMKMDLMTRWPGAVEATPDRVVRRAISALVGHLAGDSKAASMMTIPLDMSDISDFARRVYEELRRVPSGATVTYGELADRVGAAGAARAVGQAVRRNPFLVVVPCHRVLGSGGRVGGFSAPGGVVTKKALLAIEGVSASDAHAVDFDVDAAASHLRRCDASLARVIDRAGPLSLRIEKLSSPLEALARSIVYQQLAGKAAAAIYGRVCDLFVRRRPTARAILALSDEALRGAGLSRNKMAALRDLAARSKDGTVPSLPALQRMSDVEIIDRLVKVRGIGRWTAEMLLIFRLGRPDVLPAGDYGVRAGFQHTYSLANLPTPREIAARGEAWRPYRTAAAWYLWRALDLARA
ncbi:MAG: methylated-DNA--[protein]-cysteine S-methyltransferase [Polyangiaceae bacterium]|jgi:methylated-DNA-[protein]-cysteine S-methyltransferase